MSSVTWQAPLLTTQRLVLHLPDVSHSTAVAEFYRENSGHFARWDPPRPSDFTSASYWRNRLREYRDEQVAGQAVRFFARWRADLLPTEEPLGSGEIDSSTNVVAAINFTQIARGPFLSCSLGYAVDHRFEGQGVMFEALTACLDHIFDVERLHRVSAGYLPINERSGRLLRRLGFVVEGYSRDYLFIDGAWRDHVLTALINPRSVMPEIAASSVAMK